MIRRRNLRADHLPSVIVDILKMKLSFQDFTSSTVIGFEIRLEEDH